jgi:hypothetical protein
MSSTHNPLEYHRGKRLAILPVLSFALGGFGSIIGGINSLRLNAIQEAADHNAHQINYIVQEVGLGKERLDRLEGSMRKSMEQIQLQEKAIIAGRKTVVAFAAVAEYENLFDIVESELNRKTLGLNQLLNGRISPSLVNSTVMEHALGMLRERAARTNHVLPVEGTGFVYQLPASFITSKQGSLAIFVQIPILVPNNILTLHEIVTMPVAVEDSVNAVRVVPEGDFLAINSDLDGFIPLKNEELTTCERLGKLYLCDKTNFLLKDFKSYCMTSLFLDLASATSVCPTAVVPDKVVITQVERNEYYIFHPRNETLTVDCFNSRNDTRYHFRGARRIGIPEGCKGYAESYSLTSSIDHTLNVSVSSHTTKWKLRQLISNLTAHTLDILVPVPPQRDVLVETLAEKYTFEREQQFYAPAHWNFGFSMTGMIIVITSLLMCICCCRKPISRCLFGPLWNKPHPPSRRGSHSVIVQPLPLVEARPLVHYGNVQQFDEGELPDPPSYRTPRGSRGSLSVSLMGEVREAASRAITSALEASRRRRREATNLAVERANGGPSTPYPEKEPLPTVVFQ